MAQSRDDLFNLIARADAAGLRQALAEGADAGARDGFGMSLLYHAAQKGALEMVELLLEAGAEVDRSSDSGNTPLMAAAARGHAEVVQRLVAAGADTEHRNTWGINAYQWAKWAAEPDDVRVHLDSQRLQ